MSPVVLALSKSDAARALGVSTDFFDDHVRPEVRCVQAGRLLLFPVRDLEAWLDAHVTPARANPPLALRRVEAVA